MATLLKSVLRGVSALVLIAGLALRFVPPTAEEQAALGPDPPRTALVQKRLASAAMQVAPDVAVGFYAGATGLPEPAVRSVLQAVAAGEPLLPAVADAPPPALPRDQRVTAGGAKFISVRDAD